MYDWLSRACEGVWTYHMIKENNSFRSGDCASEIIREPSKSHCACTKCEAIVTNVFSHYLNDQNIDPRIHFENTLEVISRANHPAHMKKSFRTSVKTAHCLTAALKPI